MSLNRKCNVTGIRGNAKFLQQAVSHSEPFGKIIREIQVIFSKSTVFDLKTWVKGHILPQEKIHNI